MQRVWQKCPATLTICACISILSITMRTAFHLGLPTIQLFSAILSVHTCNEIYQPTSVKCSHPERSEGSVSMGTQMLRFAQHDRTTLNVTIHNRDQKIN